MVIRTEKVNPGFSRYEDATDDQLVSLVRLGDDRALDTLMARYRGLIYRAVKTSLGSLSEAEDVFQDICLSLHQNREAYQTGPAKFSSWLYRVAVNKCLDIARSSRFKCAADSLSEAIPDEGRSAEDSLQQAQVNEKLRELLNDLPHQQRLALSYYYADERDVDEIAELLQSSESAVRALLKRGKARLRETGLESAYSFVC